MRGRDAESGPAFLRTPQVANPRNTPSGWFVEILKGRGGSGSTGSSISTYLGAYLAVFSLCDLGHITQGLCAPFPYL